ncbi:MAG: hypothetical protein ABSH29_15210 [Acidimicrobiales bacterium]
MAEPLEEQASQGDVLAVGQVDAEAFPDDVDVGLAVDEPAGAVHPDEHRLVLLVELVVQIAHQRLEKVLDGEHPRHPAVLVHHDRDGTPVFAHVGQGLEHPQRFGDEKRLADLAGDLQWARIGGVPGQRALLPGPEDVVDEQNADEVVEIVVDHGEAAVPRCPHGPGDVVGLHGNGEEGDIDPGRHHLTDVHVPQVGQRLNDDALLLRSLGVPGRPGDVGPVVVRGAAPEATRATGSVATRRIWRRLRLLVGRHGVPDQLVGSPPASSWGPAPTSTGTGMYESSV